MTRSRASVYRPTLTGDNQGVYTARRNAFVSRALRSYHHIVQTQGDLYQRIIAKAGDAKKRKSILKDYILNRESKK